MEPARAKKLIWMASYDLPGLEAELREPTLLYVKAKLTLAKAKLAPTALTGFLASVSGLSGVVQDKGFAALPQEVQAEALWQVELIARMADLEKKLEKGWKIAKAGPEGQDAVILKHAKSCLEDVGSKPKTLGKLVKRMKDGEPIAPEEAQYLAMLPLAIISWAIADVIAAGLASKPR